MRSSGGHLHASTFPASHTYNDLVPWGSDPRVDHLLSSETLQVVHDGAAATRIAKTEAIARWPATYGRLRVCVPAAGWRAHELRALREVRAHHGRARDDGRAPAADELPLAI